MDERGFISQYPGWEVLAKIGSGGFGAVYEIRRDVFGVSETAALKHLRIPSEESAVSDLLRMGYSAESVKAHFRDYLNKILDEYRLMTELKGHSNIVHCEDVLCVPMEDRIGWDVFIRMELLTPLMKALDQVQTEQQIVRLGLDMANALVLCQNRSIIHRDIKPQNIFVSKDGNFKLGDFGIAKISEETSGGTMIGTYNYMAPEVYLNRPYGHAADIYSLGLVLYWLLNEHRHPFLPLPPAAPLAPDMERARSRRFNGETLPPPAHGSAALQRIVSKACAFDPAERYHRAEDLLEDLEKLDPNRGKQLRRASAAWEAQAAQHSSERESPQPVLPKEAPSVPASQEPAPASGTKNKRIVGISILLAIFLAGGALWFFLTGREATNPPAEPGEGTELAEDENAGAVLAQSAETQGIRWELSSQGVLTISGSGDMENYAQPEDAPWFSKRETIKSIVVEDGITRIGDNAFYNEYNLGSVTLSKNITEIGNNSFAFCSGLGNIAFPDTLETICGHAFEGCKALSGISFPTGLQSIGEHAFAFCTGLKEITLPSELKTLEAYSFNYCEWLERVEIPGSVTKIGEYAFYECTELSDLVISEGVVELGDSCFEECYKLTSAFFPDSLRVIGEKAFNWSGLTEISLPGNLSTIGRGAFVTRSDTLKTVSFRGSETQWQMIAIGEENEALYRAAIVFDA